MITVPQIKAARGLLDWTQRDLARVSGLSFGAIAQIERGAGNPRASSMRILQQAFEKYDVEFSDDPGVRICQEAFSVYVWKGREVWGDIEATYANGSGGEVFLSSLDDKLWQNIYPKELPIMIARRKKLKIVTRALVVNTSDNLTLPAENCRKVQKATFSHAPYYVYANKVAILKMLDPIRIILINNPTLAESFHAQFQNDWDQGEAV